MIRVPRRLRHQAHRRFLCMYACVLCERVCVLQRRVRRAASIIITSAYAHPKIIKLHLSSQWEAIYIYMYSRVGWMDGCQCSCTRPEKSTQVGWHIAHSGSSLSKKISPCRMCRTQHLSSQRRARSVCFYSCVVYTTYTQSIYMILFQF